MYVYLRYLGSISVRFCSRQYFCRVLLQVVFLSGFALGSISVRFYFMQYLYTRSPKGEGGILFYLCPSVRPSKIFFVAFISATIDGRNLIFGHKLHIGTPYRGKRFLTRQIPTSCMPKNGGIIGEHQLTVHLVLSGFTLGSISVRFCFRQYFCQVLLQVVFLSGFAFQFLV